MGCGTGTFLAMVGKSHQTCKFVGIDPDGQITKIAKNKLKEANVQAEVLVGWAEELPFKSSTDFWGLETFKTI